MSTKRERSPEGGGENRDVSSADYSETAENEGRKKRRWDSGTEGAAAAAPSTAAELKTKVQEALAKAKEASKIQAAVQERLKGLQAGVAAPGSQWSALRLDSQGRQINEKGEVVQVETSHLSTLKINQRDAQQNEALAFLERVPGSAGNQHDSEGNKHIDPRFSGSNVMRERRAFKWVKPGKYTARAQTMRMKQLSRDMHSGDYDGGEEVVRRVVQLEPIPSVEWWDEALVGEESYDSEVNREAITNLIHIPVMLAPVTEGDANTGAAPMPIMLTQKERKKIKRINKMEKQKEEQDKVRLGLAAPAEPKMRLSNFMRVLGNESIMEPSAMEQKVRKQMAERAQRHEQANEDRKLTPEQLKEKKRKKLTENTDDGLVVCVFRAGDLTDGKRRFQVDIHAQQFQLSGAAVIYGNCNVVVVEGGPKNMKKFIRLMEHRIKWVPDHIVDHNSDDEEDGGKAANMEDDDEDPFSREKKIYKQCKLVWKGVSHKRVFRNFRFELCRTEALARKVFKDKGVPQYWDMCRNYQEDV